MSKCQSNGVLGYRLDPNRFYNCNQCFIDRGIVGGNTASLYSGNLVDLESDLMGRTRPQSHCNSVQFRPGTIIQGVSCGKPKMEHLPVCSLIDYKPKACSKTYDVCGQMKKGKY